jgi:hypothetical protein
MATDAQVVTVVKNELTWLQHHERLILVFMVLLVAGWLGNRYLNNAAVDAKTKYGIAQAESTQARAGAETAAKTYQATIDALTQQNASLAVAVASRQTVLVQKQTEIKTLPLPQVASEWQRLIGGSGDLLNFTDGLKITEDGARRTVTQLEAVPVLTANLNDEMQIAVNRQSEIDKGATLIAALNKEITANDVTCKAQVASVKADAHKSKRTFFVLGFIAGISTRILGKF